MAEKKMTQVEALEIAVEIMNEYAVLDEHIEAKAVLEHMIATKNKPRVKRENKEAIAFRESLVERMKDAEGPLKAGEIAELMGEGVSPQKVANNLRVLVADGRVTKIAGEKAKDAATYILA